MICSILVCFKNKEMCNGGLEFRVVGVSRSAWWLQYTLNAATGRLARHHEVLTLTYHRADVSSTGITGHKMAIPGICFGQRKGWRVVLTKPSAWRGARRLPRYTNSRQRPFFKHLYPSLASNPPEPSPFLRHTDRPPHVLAFVPRSPL